MDREPADSGEFVLIVTPERVLTVFEAVEGPVITSSDVAAELDCTTEATRRTLEQLREEGRLACYRGVDEDATGIELRTMITKGQLTREASRTTRRDRRVRFRELLSRTD